MHHAVNVEYNIKDVITASTSKKSKSSSYSRQSTVPVKTSQKVGVNEEKQHNFVNSVFKLQSTNQKTTNNNEQYLGGTGVSEGQSPNRPPPKRPSSSNGSVRKMNPSSKIYQGEAPWISTGECPNRDLLRMKQDMAVSLHKSKHPYYSDDPVPIVTPNLSSDAERSTSKQKSIIQRERHSPNTNGAVLNDKLPYHPYLREVDARQQNDGIHSDRWSAATLPEDDPLRSRPTTAPARKSRESFHRDFQSAQLDRSGTHEVSVLRSLSSVSGGAW